MKNFSPEQSEFLQKLHHVSHNYYCIVEAGGSFLEFSDNWATFLGLSREQVLSEHFLNLIHPEDHASTNAIIERISAGELIVDFRNRFRSFSGKYRWLEWRAAINPKVGAIFAAGTDITNEVEQDEFLHMSQEIATIGSWEFDIEANILAWSDTTYDIHKLARDTPIDIKDAINFYAPDCREEIGNYVQNAITKQVPWDTELKIITTDGAEKWVRAYGKPEVVNQKTVRLKGVFQDIDSFKIRELENLRISRKLENINRDLEQFTYVASHDLKSPLRAISNLASWIEEDEINVLSDESKKHLNLIRKRIIRMENLLSGLLEYSQVGAYGLESTRIDLESLFNESVNLIETHENVEIETDLNVTEIMSLRAPLEIVVRNVVSNAIKHNGTEFCKIKFSSKYGVSNLVLTIEDNGLGVSEKYYETVFEIFKTLKTKGSSESSGLGLPIVQKVIKDIGGEISLDVSSLGGLKVTIFWPKELT